MGVRNIVNILIYIDLYRVGSIEILKFNTEAICKYYHNYLQK